MGPGVKKTKPQGKKTGFFDTLGFFDLVKFYFLLFRFFFSPLLLIFNLVYFIF